MFAATGQGDDDAAGSRRCLRRRRSRRARDRRDAARASCRSAARQRELSLVIVMLVLGTFVAIQAPQLLSRLEPDQVSVLASIIAIAAVGEAIVVITRNVDLSVEAVIGLVAFVVADLLANRTLTSRRDGLRPRPRPGPRPWSTGSWWRSCASPRSSRRSARCRSTAACFLLAGGKQVTLTDLPAGYTDLARATFVGIPLFVVFAVAIVVVAAILLRQTRFGRSVYAVGSNPEAAGILGIRAGVVTFVVFSRVRPPRRDRRRACGGMQFGTINATRRDRRDPPGHRGRGRGRRQHLRRLGDRRRGRARRAVPGLHLQRADPPAPVPVLAPGDLRHRDPASPSRSTPRCCAASSDRPAGRRPR